MIRILCVGKVKEKFYRDAIDEYMKRLVKYHKIVIDEVPDSNIRMEAEVIKKHLNPRDYIITLEIGGQEFSSVELAEFIDKTMMIHSNITFIIGGSNGLHEDVKKISNYQLSFSKLTFPHQLFRVILLEQIYRSFRILHHESYHK